MLQRAAKQEWRKKGATSRNLGPVFCPYLYKITVGREIWVTILNLITESQHGVQTKLVFADFSDKTLQIYDHIRDSLAGLDVGILVNNVGVIQSQPAYFNEVDEQTIVNMVQVRV